MCNPVYSCLIMFATVYSFLFTYVYPTLHVFTYVYTSLPMSKPVYSCLPMFTCVYICGIAGENRPTGAKFPMEIIDLQAIKEIFGIYWLFLLYKSWPTF